MINTICILILLYAISGTVSIPTVCFALAWITAGLQLVRLGFGIAKNLK